MAHWYGKLRKSTTDAGVSRCGVKAHAFISQTMSYDGQIVVTLYERNGADHVCITALPHPDIGVSVAPVPVYDGPIAALVRRQCR